MPLYFQRVVIVAIIVLLSGTVAARADCAADIAHSTETGETRVKPDGTIQVLCKCKAAYVFSVDECIHIGDNLVVDPKSLLDSYECNLIREQIAALATKRQWLEVQRQKLNSLVDAAARAAKDVDDATLELLQDSSVQTLNFVDASVQILTGQGAIPAASSQNMRISITVAKAGLNAISAATAPADSRQRVEKAAAAMFLLKDAVPFPPAGMSPEEWQSFQRASNIIPKMANIADRIFRLHDDGNPWRDLAQSLDELADFGAQYYAPFKATRSAVHMTLGAGTFWMMRRDRDSINDAFVQLQTARRYYTIRIGNVAQLQAFYAERVSGCH